MSLFFHFVTFAYPRHCISRTIAWSYLKPVSAQIQYLVRGRCQGLIKLHGMVPRRIVIFWLLTLTLPAFVSPYRAISMSKKLLNMRDYNLRQLRYLGLYCTSREFFTHLIRADLGLTGNINSLHESPSICHHILKSQISATNCGMVSVQSRYPDRTLRLPFPFCCYH